MNSSTRVSRIKPLSCAVCTSLPCPHTLPTDEAELPRSAQQPGHARSVSFQPGKNQRRHEGIVRVRGVVSLALGPLLSFRLIYLYCTTAPPHRRLSCNQLPATRGSNTRFQARRVFSPTCDQLILSTKLCLNKMKREQSDIDAQRSSDISCEEPSCTANDFLSVLQRAIEISDGKDSSASPSRPTGWILPRSRRSTSGGAFGVASLAQALRFFHEEQEGRRAMQRAATSGSAIAKMA